MKKIYYLSTCSTCSRIIKDLNLSNDFEYHEIKSTKISDSQLTQMAKMSGSFESLFSKRAVKYKSLNLKEQQLSENDYKNLILKEYTFLKRPVLIIGNKIFVGNAKNTIEDAANFINS